jgi:toxin ParE1/3/4
MTAGSADWEVRLAAGADLDLGEIVAWTEEKFGSRQADIYEETLARAIEALGEGPAVPGAKMRPELGSDIFVLHCARNGRKARHFLVCRVSEAASNPN